MSATRMWRSQIKIVSSALRDCKSTASVNLKFALFAQASVRCPARTRAYSSEAQENAERGATGYTRRLSDKWDEKELHSLPQHLRPMRGETLDLILRQKVYLLQSRRGYRANVDSHILAYFASGAYNSLSHRSRCNELRVLDLGAGNGLVSILFAKGQQPVNLHMIELQPQLADRARRNLELNNIPGVVIQHDLKAGDLPSDLAGQFDVVLINPPFYLVGSRNPPRRREKLLAHMESSASISDFLHAAYLACDPQNVDAFVAMIHDVNELPRLRKAFEKNNLRAKDSAEMLHTYGEDPSRVLLKLVPCRTKPPYRGQGHVVDPDSDQFSKDLPETPIPNPSPIVLHPKRVPQSTYTPEIEAFLDGLPLPSLRIGRLRSA